MSNKNYNLDFQNKNIKLQEILDKINNLPNAGEGGTDTSDATATAANILQGQTAYIATGKTTGTMPNNGAITQTFDGINVKSVTIPKGYTSGGTVGLDSTIDNEVSEQASLITQILEVAESLPEKESGGGADTSDATAVAADIMAGETAYVASGKVTGTFTIDNEVNNQNALIANIKSALLNKASGGSSLRTDGEYLVRVIDYDGSTLKEEWLNTGDIFELPTPPTNDRLTFSTWSSPVDIVDNTVTVTDDNIFIGALYKTKSGATEVDIYVNENTGLEFTFKNFTGTTSVDWGDGTTENVSTATHTYAQPGNYTVKIYGATAVNAYCFGQSGSVRNYTVKKVFLSNTITSIGNYTFYYLSSLEVLSLSNSIQTIGTHLLVGSLKLESIILPTNITEIKTRWFYESGIEIIVIPKGVTKIGQETFNTCHCLTMFSFPETLIELDNINFSNTPGVTEIKLPNSLQNVGNNCFYSSLFIKSITFGESIASIGSGFLSSNSKYIELLDFSKAKQVPTLGGAITITNLACRILVPSTLYDEWIAATNWSAVSQYIFPV